ncbi:MAG TPA: hypothetical protein VLL95_10440, partial [Phnomibacter sp.]|nr:hypothetical protein [Phnomibacter sp.]
MRPSKVKLAISTFLLLAFSIMATAHEFWLEPVSFWGSRMVIRLKVGEHYSGENWKGDYGKVRSLAFVNHNQVNTLDPHAVLAHKGDSLQLSVPFEGTQTLIFNSTNSFIQLGA